MSKGTHSWGYWLVLVGVMAVTRNHHLGTASLLPDATLAIFFLSGVLFPSPSYPIMLLVVAGLSDFLAISSGVSAWCVTPAYFMLVPAYLASWAAGRWAGRFPMEQSGFWLRLFPALLVGSSTAFWIANVGFYLLSGYFTEMGMGEFFLRVGDGYFLSYVGAASFYVACWGMVQGAVLLMRGEYGWRLAAR